MQCCRWRYLQHREEVDSEWQYQCKLISRHQKCILNNLWNKSTMKQWVKRLTPAHVILHGSQKSPDAGVTAADNRIHHIITCRVAIPATEAHSTGLLQGTLYFICISCWVENKTLWSSAIKVLPICNVLVTNPLSPYNNWVYGIIIWPNINKNKLSIGGIRGNQIRPNIILTGGTGQGDVVNNEWEIWKLLLLSPAM